MKWRIVRGCLRIAALAVVGGTLGWLSSSLFGASAQLVKDSNNRIEIMSRKRWCERKCRFIYTKLLLVFILIWYDDIITEMYDRKERVL